jgi:hypothetical protein
VRQGWWPVATAQSSVQAELCVSPSERAQAAAAPTRWWRGANCGKGLGSLLRPTPRAGFDSSECPALAGALGLLARLALATTNQSAGLNGRANRPQARAAIEQVGEETLQSSRLRWCNADSSRLRWFRRR